MLFNIARAATALVALSSTTLFVSAAPTKTKAEIADTCPPPPSPSPPPPTSAPTATIITSCALPGHVALTYDDGPSDYTQQLVDYLNSKNVTATFFVNGNNYGSIYDHRSAVQKAYQSGHQIASHTYSHQDLNALDQEGIDSQMSQLDVMLKDIIGKRPRFMRPPYGNANQDVLNQLTRLGYYVITWNIDSNDWRHPDNVDASFQEYTSVLSSASAKSSGYIALQHDVYPKTVTELTPRVVTYLQGAGYKLVTVGQCLGLERAEWYRD